jgi:hypothetical protein
MAGKKQALNEYYKDSEAKLAPTKAGQSESDHVTVPKVWKSSKDHPTAYLVYITAKEAALLAKKDMHGSGVDREMHFGPNGVPSYQGDGGGGDGGGGDSGGNDSAGASAGAAAGEGVGAAAGEAAGSAAAGATDSGGGIGEAVGAGIGAGVAGAGAAAGTSTTGASSSTGADETGILGTGAEPLFSDAMAVTTFEQPAAAAVDSGPRQFETREQGMRRRASAAGATRIDNDVDLLGYRGGSKRRTGAARQALGRGR